MKTISLKIPETLYTQIVQSAKEKGQNMSYLIREAINDYFAKKNKLKSGSFLSEAENYAGCLEGVQDLSTNKKYLKGYGG